MDVCPIIGRNASMTWSSYLRQFSWQALVQVLNLDHFGLELFQICDTGIGMQKIQNYRR